jgi:hypothetical protein
MVQVMKEQPNSSDFRVGVSCAECGMPLVSVTDYHPYAACLIFKQCHDSETVTISLDAVMAYALNYGSPPPPLAKREHLGDVIETALRTARLQNWHIDGDEGSHLPLVDHLSVGEDCSTGNDEIELLAEEILAAIEEDGQSQPPSGAHCAHGIPINSPSACPTCHAQTLERPAPAPAEQADDDQCGGCGGIGTINMCVEGVGTAPTPCHKCNGTGRITATKATAHE